MRTFQPARPSAMSAPLQAEGGLRPLHIYLLFFFWTLFSVFLYARFTTLGDSNSYLTGAYDDEHELRTIVIQDIAGLVYSIAHNDLLAHLVFSAFAARNELLEQQRLLCDGFGLGAEAHHQRLVAQREQA